MNKLISLGNLNWGTTELTLGRHFEVYGDIKTVKIIEDHDGRSKGFGYVNFETKEAVAKALKADDSELEGRNVKVSIVKKREFKPRENK